MDVETLGSDNWVIVYTTGGHVFAGKVIKQNGKDVELYPAFSVVNAKVEDELFSVRVLTPLGMTVESSRIETTYCARQNISDWDKEARESLFEDVDELLWVLSSENDEDEDDDDEELEEVDNKKLLS